MLDIFRNPLTASFGELECFIGELERFNEFGLFDDTIAGWKPTRIEIIESRAENLRALEIRFRRTSSSLNLSANTTSESKKRKGKGMSHDKYLYVSTGYYSYYLAIVVPDRSKVLMCSFAKMISNFRVAIVQRERSNPVILSEDRNPC